MCYKMPSGPQMIGPVHLSSLLRAEHEAIVEGNENLCIPSPMYWMLWIVCRRTNVGPNAGDSHAKIGRRNGQ
jgi:hypothetical protein